MSSLSADGDPLFELKLHRVFSNVDVVLVVQIPDEVMLSIVGPITYVITS